MTNFEERNEQRPGTMRFRATVHIGMGIFYVIIGILIIYVKYFGAMELPQTFAYVLGGMMVLYGAFRIWRGFTDLRNIPKRDIRRDFPSLHGMDEPKDLQ